MSGERQSICRLPMDNAAQTLQIRVHGVDGSIQTFTQHEDDLIRQTLDGFRPTRMLTQTKITIAGECSLTTFVPSQVTRVDLVTEHLSNWALPPGPVGAVELSEPAFRALVQDQPRRESRRASRAADKSVVALLDITVVGGQRVFLARQMAVERSAQQMQGFDTLFTTSSFWFLMRACGIAVLNVANLARFTVYRGPMQASADLRPGYHAHTSEPGNPHPQGGLSEIPEREAA